MKALKTLSEKKYYKYGDEPWVQPVLTANGTMGGDSFAVWATAQRSSYPAYYAIIGNEWVSNTSTKPCIYEFYNKAPLRVSKIVWNNNSDGNYNITGGYFQGSKEGSKWTNLGTFDNNSSANATRTLDILNPDYYKYYRFYVTSATSSEVIIGNLIITATQQTIEAGTPEDYDFSEGGRQYYKYVYSDWIQPVLTANGTMGGDSFAVNAKSQRSRLPAYSAINDNGEWVGSESSTSTSSWYKIYNPKPLKITQVTWINNSATWYNLTGGTFEGSNDDSNWTVLGQIDSVNTANALKTITISNPDAYLYYRWNITNISKNSSGQSSDGYMHSLKITATQQTIEAGTPEDYDYYKDNNVYKILEEEIRKYYKYTYTYNNSYTNPALSSNGTPYEDNFAVKDGGNNSNVYRGFNGVIDNAYTCTSYLLFYFKNPVNIKSLQYTGHSDTQARYRLMTATLYGSNDNGETWEQVAYYKTNTTVSGTCDFSENTQFFNTYKLVPTWNSLGWAIYEAVINGNERLLKVTESTALDYDFYEDNLVYKAFRSYKKGEYNGN